MEGGIKVNKINEPQQEQGAEDRALTKYDLAALKTSTEVAKKNLAYGDAVAKSGEIMKILYPNGIQPHQYADALAITRTIDKMFRIATDNDPYGEDPWGDINGYSLLRKMQRQEQKDQEARTKIKEESSK